MATTNYNWRTDEANIIDEIIGEVETLATWTGRSSFLLQNDMLGPDEKVNLPAKRDPNNPTDLKISATLLCGLDRKMTLWNGSANFGGRRVWGFMEGEWLLQPVILPIKDEYSQFALVKADQISAEGTRDFRRAMRGEGGSLRGANQDRAQSWMEGQISLRSDFSET